MFRSIDKLMEVLNKVQTEYYIRGNIAVAKLLDKEVEIEALQVECRDVDEFISQLKVGIIGTDLIYGISNGNAVIVDGSPENSIRVYVRENKDIKEREGNLVSVEEAVSYAIRGVFQGYEDSDVDAKVLKYLLEVPKGVNMLYVQSLLMKMGIKFKSKADLVNKLYKAVNKGKNTCKDD